MDAEGDQLARIRFVSERIDFADKLRRRAMDAERNVLVEIVTVAERLHLFDEVRRHVVDGEREEALVIEIARGDAE
jgi:hypothetical protein